VEKNYTLTKTSILSGIQCEKKLWFDLNQENQWKDKALYRAGNRFGEVVRNHYGNGLDLSNEKDLKTALDKTNEAANSDEIKVIYEGAFLYQKTYIRADVLIKKNNQWTLLEAKSATKVKDINIFDIAIQSFIIKKSGLDLNSTKLIHINNEFLYKGNLDYSNLIKEKDLTNEVLDKEKEIEDLIKKFNKIIINKCPDIETGKQCKNPYPCHYLEQCSPLETDIKRVSYQILPYHGKNLDEYCKKNNISKLVDVPKEELQANRKDYAKNFHYIIQQSHKNNAYWINKDIKENFKDWNWPYYFMDFETVQQTVPIIKNTTPFEQLPFQWSLHRWDSEDSELKEFSFLDFDSKNIELNFLNELVKTLCDKGTIFVHNHPFEKGVLNRLKDKPNLSHFKKDVDNIIDRIVDTLFLTRKNFYGPQMFGKYSLKNIVKAIPTDIKYESTDDQSVSDGSDAQLAWFICTDPTSKEEDKSRQRKELIEYCAKDTKAMYDLIKFFMKENPS